MRKVFFFILILSLSSKWILAAPIAQRHTCISLIPGPIPWAERKGQSKCWVSLSPSLCLSKQLWQRWLEHPESSSLCGIWRGHWEIFSPPNNSLKLQKVRIQRWITEELPPPSMDQEPHGFGWKLWIGIERTREHLSNVLAPHDPFGLFRRLVLNEKSPHSPGNLFRLFGFVHLLTVTGIHLYALSRICSQFFLQASRLMNIPISISLPLSRLFSACLWIFAWLIAGARPGMIRPLIIVCIRKAAQILGFRWRKWSPLSIALLCDMIWAVFQHSVTPESISARIIYALAVGGGMLGNAGHIQLALSSWLLAAFWDAWHQNYIAPLTPIFSLLTIPIFTLGVYPGILIEFLMSFLLRSKSHPLLDVLLDSIHWGLLKLIQISLKTPTLWHISHSSLLLGMTLTTLFFSLGKWNRKNLFLFFSSLFFLKMIQSMIHHNPQFDSSPRAQRVEQIDVGQGDAALILAESQNVGMIDTGPKDALSDEAWLLYFLQRGITQLDWVALTHLDQDHAGGLTQLMRLLPIHCVSVNIPEIQTDRGKKLIELLNENQIQFDPLPFGESTHSDCVPYPSLSPRSKQKHPIHQANGNMSSFLIPLVSHGFYLSTGDADSREESRIGKWVLKQTQMNDSPRILKVGHHGSQTSSSSNFLEEIHPTEAWISVGTGNHYGHPAASVLEKLKSHSIKIRRTDRDGALQLK